MKALVCYVAWLNDYRGPSEEDPAVWKRKGWPEGVWPANGGELYYLSECHLFEPCQTKSGDIRLFGSVQGQIAIKNLGGDPDKGYAEGVFVIWCARNPDSGHLQIVGSYRNARVHTTHGERMQKRLLPAEWKRLEAKHEWNSNVDCAASDGIFLSPERRLDAASIVPGLKESWSSSSCFRYMEVSDAEAFAIRKLSGSSSQTTSPDGPIEHAQRQVWQRQGQGPFRKSMLQPYNRRCAVTGCATEQVLDACHILGAAEDGASHAVSNGLLLRTDLHALFDLNLLCIHPTKHTVWVADTLDETYQCFAGQPISLPKDPAQNPDRKQLQARWKRRPRATRSVR